MSSNNDEELNQLIERDKRAKKILFIGYILVNIFMLFAGAYSLFTFIALIAGNFVLYKKYQSILKKKKKESSPQEVESSTTIKITPRGWLFLGAWVLIIPLLLGLYQDPVLFLIFGLSAGLPLGILAYVFINNRYKTLLNPEESPRHPSSNTDHVKK